MIEHLRIAQDAKIPAPEKPVFIAMAIAAGHYVPLDVEGIAARTGYDPLTVEDAIKGLFDRGLIYLVHFTGPGSDEFEHVQFTGTRSADRHW